MIRIDIQRTKFYKELEKAEQKKYFENKNHKYLHNIDNIYYSCSFKDDSCENKLIEKLFIILSAYREEMTKKKVDNIEIDLSDGLVLTRKKFSIYGYCLSMPECYDVFIADYLPNLQTPRIVVQLRSMPLWVKGYNAVLQESFKTVESLFLKFGLEIQNIHENRIDYCYHTNSIQSPETHFEDNRLRSSLNTTFGIYHKVGHVYKSDKGFGSSLSLEYLSLGSRKTNSLFFRIYDKTKEVIDNGYKGFFFDIWYNEGLISYYDKFCLEYAYKSKSWDNIPRAKIEFYLRYGCQELYKMKFREMVNNENGSVDELKSICKCVLPEITTILNVEFETRRKFYHSCESQIEILPCENLTDNRFRRIYSILQNRKIFLNYLADVTVSFRKKDLTYESWWSRLRNLKFSDDISSSEGLIREYASNLEAGKIEKDLIRKCATLSIYRNKHETGFVADVSDFLACVNDNDMIKQISVYREQGIENIEGIETQKLAEYRFYKAKKYKALKKRLNSGDTELISSIPKPSV